MLQIRAVAADEHDAVADLLAATYLAEGWADASDEPVLRDTARRVDHATVLVALRDGALVGTVTVTTQGGPYAEIADDGEAVIQMLVTAPTARDHGAGTALVQACVDAAREAGCTAVRLWTQQPVAATIRICQSLGFERAPERDSTSSQGMDLIGYYLPLRWCSHCGQPGLDHPNPLDPPRYCTHCRRRMVVQVHPTGWSARCAEHGTRLG